MTIADELAALPKMPDVTPDEQYLWEVISFFETRLALAERCLKDCACPEKRRDKSMREIEDDARAYLAHRTEAVLKDSRRLWYWKPADNKKFLSGVAVAGLHPDSKLGATLPLLHLTETCEIILFSEAAEQSIRQMHDDDCK